MIAHFTLRCRWLGDCHQGTDSLTGEPGEADMCPLSEGLCDFPVAAVTNDYYLTLNNKHLLSYNSVGLKPHWAKIQVSAHLCPLWRI